MLFLLLSFNLLVGVFTNQIHFLDQRSNYTNKYFIDYYRLAVEEPKVELHGTWLIFKYNCNVLFVLKWERQVLLLGERSRHTPRDYSCQIGVLDLKNRIIESTILKQTADSIVIPILYSSTLVMCVYFKENLKGRVFDCRKWSTINYQYWNKLESVSLPWIPSFNQSVWYNTVEQMNRSTMEADLIEILKQLLPPRRFQQWLHQQTATVQCTRLVLPSAFEPYSSMYQCESASSAYVAMPPVNNLAQDVMLRTTDHLLFFSEDRKKFTAYQILANVNQICIDIVHPINSSPTTVYTKGLMIYKSDTDVPKKHGVIQCDGYAKTMSDFPPGVEHLTSPASTKSTRLGTFDTEVTSLVSANEPQTSMVTTVTLLSVVDVTNDSSMVTTVRLPTVVDVTSDSSIVRTVTLPSIVDVTNDSSMVTTVTSPAVVDVTNDSSMVTTVTSPAVVDVTNDSSMVTTVTSPAVVDVTSDSSIVRTVTLPSIVDVTNDSSMVTTVTSPAVVDVTNDSSMVTTVTSPAVVDVTNDSSMVTTVTSPAVVDVTNDSSMVTTVTSPAVVDVTNDSSMVTTVTSPAVVDVTNDSSMVTTVTSPAVVDVTNDSSMVTTVTSPTVVDVTNDSSMVTTVTSPAVVDVTNDSSMTENQPELKHQHQDDTMPLEYVILIVCIPVILICIIVAAVSIRCIQIYNRKVNESTTSYSMSNQARQNFQSLEGSTVDNQSVQMPIHMDLCSQPQARPSILLNPINAIADVGSVTEESQSDTQSSTVDAGDKSSTVRSIGQFLELGRTYHPGKPKWHPETLDVKSICTDTHSGSVHCLNPRADNQDSEPVSIGQLPIQILKRIWRKKIKKREVQQATSNELAKMYQL